MGEPLQGVGAPGACVLCGRGFGDGAFCASCGALRPAAPTAPDPLIGAVIADRYEILAVINAGGMGRVYRATQRSLDRAVAVKVIEPLVLDGMDGDDLTVRFMREARLASALNHPNVVSILDFGRAGTAVNAPLFLAMELLTGPSLQNVLESGVALPAARVADILRQVLAALGEAHALGITHRDIKPSNIVLEARRGDADHVKVIDFGIARLGMERDITRRGRVMGTPHYMAPETVAAPSVDLYAVGVMLFEMLCGRVPFDAASAVEVLRLHATSPRPDPRKVVPERHVPAALAEVCIRAMAIDPAARYPDALALAEAITDAASAGPWTPRHSSLFPRRAAAPAGQVGGALGTADTVPPPSPGVGREGAPLMVLRSPVPPALHMPTVGRDEHIAWTKDLLSRPPEGGVIVWWGRTGAGRSRMLRETASIALRDGRHVLVVRTERGPAQEVGYTSLRRIIARLLDVRADDPRLADGFGAAEAPVREGLREAFGSSGVSAGGDPEATRQALIDALRWASGRALERAGGALLVALDDVDRMDGISRACVWDFVLEGLPTPLTFALTCENVPARASHPRVRDKELTGLSRADAHGLVSQAGRARDSRPASGRRISPLYIEQYRRWRAEREKERAPAHLEEIVTARVHALAPMSRRVLQAMAVVGSATSDRVVDLLDRREGVDDAWSALSGAGFLTLDGDRGEISHFIFGQVALDGAPAGTVQALHARALEAVEASPAMVELRAHHAIRARADLAAFVLVEQAAALRAGRGDHDGAIASLTDGYIAARTSFARAEIDAQGCVVFGRKLAAALHAAGRTDQAHGVLSEILQTIPPADAARIELLEELARVAKSRGKPEEEARWRREALESREEVRTSVRRVRQVLPATADRRGAQRR